MSDESMSSDPLPAATSTLSDSTTENPPPSTPPPFTPPSATTPTVTPPTATPPSSTQSPPTRATSAPTTTGPIPTATPLPSVGIPGVNDPTCRSNRPPVVLLHGTFSKPAANFTGLAAALQRSGRCVFAPLYGAIFGYGGIGRIEDSAVTVGAFIDRVHELDTSQLGDARQVDVVAFSQGALVLRTALQRDLDPATVRLAVFLAPNYHGTTVALAAKVPAAACPACAEQAAGSGLLRELANGGELAPGALRYATLSISTDAWVRPVENQSPVGPADRVRRQVLQDACPDARVEHSTLPSAPSVIIWTLAALDTVGRPPTTFSCS